MATSTMAEALAASLPAPQAPVVTPAPPAADSIPPSMSKLVDVEADIPIERVVAKIVKHSQESRGAGGLLLGIDLDGVVEISNSFPMPSVSHAQETEDDKAARSAARYQASMLRSLKDIQRDDNVVGMYQSSSLGAYLSASLIESLVAQHDKLRHGGIVVVHDVSHTPQSNASFRAFRLSSKYLEVQKSGRFTSQQLAANGLTFDTILEELPLHIRNSSLLNSYLSTLRSPTAVRTTGYTSTLPTSSEPELAPNFTVLDLETPSRLERNLEQMIEKLDEYKNEESNVAFLGRQIGREKMKAESYIAKRREENAARVAQGLAPLPEEDVSRLFKIPSEPSRLESMLLLGQIEGLGKNLEQEAGEILLQSYVARSGAVA